MDKSSLEALIKWLEIGAAVFGVIVVVGVAGESFFGIRLLWNNWKLQRVQGAESEALRADVAQANQRAAEANARAGEAQLALAKFKAPRKLSSEQRARIASKLRKFPGTRFVLAVDSTPEALAFMTDINSALVDGGWKWEPPEHNDKTGLIITVGNPKAVEFHRSGLAVGFPSEARATLMVPADQLATALQAEGFSVQTGTVDNLSANPDAVIMIVGSK